VSLRAACALAALALLPSVGRAHPVGLSRSELTISGASARAELRGSAREFGLELPGAADGAAVTPAARDAALAATLGRVTLRQDGSPCALAPGALAWEPPDGFVVAATWTCPRPIASAEVELGFLASLPQGHTHLARAVAGGSAEQHVARAGLERFTVSRGETARSARRRSCGSGSSTSSPASTTSRSCSQCCSSRRRSVAWPSS
jgi:hypothetical protein